MIVKLVGSAFIKVDWRLSLRFARYASSVTRPPSKASKKKPSVFKTKPTASVESLLQSVKIDIPPDMMDQFENPIPLLKTLTFELKESLIGNVTAKKYRMEALIKWIETMHKLEYPLPTSLNRRQWDQLLLYDNLRAVTFYFDAIHDGNDEIEDTLADIDKVNQESYSPLTPDPKALSRLIGKDVNLKNKWEEVCEQYENLQQEGEELWPFPGEKAIRMLLNASDIPYVLRYLAFKRSKQLELYLRQRADLANQAKLRQTCIDGKGTILPATYALMINQYDEYRVARESMSEWGNPVVIDFTQPKNILSTMKDNDKDHYIKKRVTDNVYKAIKLNRGSPNPFFILLANMEPFLLDYFESTKSNVRLPLSYTSPSTNVTPMCYSEHFPKERLVYVTRSPGRVLTYNPDDIYVIGINDLRGKCNEYEGIVKAKKLGLRIASLPILDITGLKVPTETFSMLGILLDYCRTQDWLYAMRWIHPDHLYLTFANKVSPSNYEKCAFLTQQKLWPESYNSEKGLMSPAEYKILYSKYRNLGQEPDLLTWSGLSETMMKNGVKIVPHLLRGDN